MYKIIFDHFDTSSAQSDVSFERLIFILKMALIGSCDHFENINGSQNKAPKAIEVRTDTCQNYHIISSFYHSCAFLINKITKNSQFLILNLFR